MNKSSDPASGPQPVSQPAAVPADTRPRVSSGKPRRRRKAARPAKPYPEFPLFPHATKRWAKKIKGRLVYFGPWADPQGALDKYLAQKDDLYAGRRPVAAEDVLTVEKLANKFLAHKRHLLDTREIAQRTWDEYHGTCQRIIGVFGWSRAVSDLRSDDFETYRAKMSKTVGPVRLGNEIQRVRSLFKYAFDAGHIEKPVRFGPGFKKPSKKTLRLHRAAQGVRMFEREEIHRMLATAGKQLRAMIFLGVNCGFGNADCGTLPIAALDLERGWLNYGRPKTGIDRRCKLWPETVAALREVLSARKQPRAKAHAGLVFITMRGGAWAKDVADSPVSKETRKLLDQLGINGKRNFYALRHTFETVGGETRDQVAVDAVMGHADDSMAGHYRERISDARLAAVADHVHAWLFAAEASGDGGDVLTFSRTTASA
jgi:integrase